VGAKLEGRKEQHLGTWARSTWGRSIGAEVLGGDAGKNHYYDDQNQF
jgi:hypothetical protein